MSLGGVRNVLVAALLVTVGLAPTLAAQETCLGAGPVETCVDDPGRTDAGSISLVDGEVTAQAEGGLVTGTGEATFVVDYEVDQPVADDELLGVVFEVEVLDKDGDRLGQDRFRHYPGLPDPVAPGEAPDDGELEATVSTVAPKVEGGTVEVSAYAMLFGPNGTEVLGQAQSVSPVTFALAPAEDQAERTRVTDTVDAGSFDAGPSGATAETVDGELVVADDTAVRLEATGDLNAQGFSDVDRLFQRAEADLYVETDDRYYHAGLDPIYERCYSSPCSATAQTVPVELSVVVPGDLLQPGQELDTSVRSDYYLSVRDQDAGDGERVYERGRASGDNLLLAAGP
jgi:hypothetical protein